MTENSSTRADPRFADVNVVHGYEHAADSSPPVIGRDATIREGTIIYNNTTIGDGFSTGHHAIIREETTIGDDVLVGTNTVIDGYSTIGSHVSLQTGVYIPSYTTIGSNVFIGPSTTLTNDPYPVRQEVDLEGPTIEDGVSIGANATILPGITIGKNAFVAAGTIVTADVPPDTLAIGTPAEHRELPDELSRENRLR